MHHANKVCLHRIIETQRYIERKLSLDILCTRTCLIQAIRLDKHEATRQIFAAEHISFRWSSMFKLFNQTNTKMRQERNFPRVIANSPV
jgi:hypothetical protein